MDSLPKALTEYLSRQDARRADRVRDFLASLTDRERSLFRDAAVMGFVQGRLISDDEPHPKDSYVMAEVVAACQAHPDLYPAVDADQTPPTVLTAAERQSLRFALDLAFDRMVSDDGFTDEDEAALEKLRRLADEAQPGPPARDETLPVGATPMTVYLATPCDTCRHTMNWHRNDVGCTVPHCVCSRFHEPTEG